MFLTYKKEMRISGVVVKCTNSSEMSSEMEVIGSSLLLSSFFSFWIFNQGHISFEPSCRVPPALTTTGYASLHHRRPLWPPQSLLSGSIRQSHWWNTMDKPRRGSPVLRNRWVWKDEALSAKKGGDPVTQRASTRQAQKATRGGMRESCVKCAPLPHCRAMGTVWRHVWWGVVCFLWVCLVSWRVRLETVCN